jgi:hypothetical protein
MARGDALTTTATPGQNQRVEQLRHRAVLWEAELSDAHLREGRKHNPNSVARVASTPHRWPLLAAYIAAHNGWPPNITRDPSARLRHMQRMRDAHGPLVLLRLTLSDLDGLPLKTTRLTSAARPLIKSSLGELLRPKTPYNSSIQRGPLGSTHSHLTAPHGRLWPHHAGLVAAVLHGPGGGILLLEGRAHGVVILDTLLDFQRVACYTTRDPDGRLDTPGTDAYFDALEAELARKLQKEPRVRLGWPGTTPSKRLTKRLIPHLVT